MEQLIDSYKKSKNLHHAYFLVGDGEEIFLKLKDFLEKSIGVKTTGNPDFWNVKFNTLTIDEARQIAQSQERKDFSGSKKIFIITADFITEEAQNSLLKVFEEPTEGTHFFIISPQDMLLPTLRSRMQVISHIMEVEKTESILKLKFKDRLEKVKEVVDAIKDEEATKQDAILLLNKIEKELYDLGVEKSKEQLEICEDARQSLYDRGAPIKIILENVMLSI
jgi:DNA polymerase III delta prime subunit